MSRCPVLKKPLLLLDRDGTLIEERPYISNPKWVKLLPGAAQGLIQLKRAGFKRVVVSNQSGIGRGIVTPAQLNQVNRRFLQRLKAKKAGVDGLYWCPHKPSARCSCRKPNLGMVKRASKDLGVSWKRSISVGDKPSDVQLGQRTGGYGVLVLTGHGKTFRRRSGADYVAKDFKQAVAWIMKIGKDDHDGQSKRKSRRTR